MKTLLADFKPVLRSSKFPYLWASQILSQLTINIMNFLLLIRLFSITGSTAAASLLWVAYALPAIILGPFGAAAVDLVEKRKLLVMTNFLQALVIFVFALTHQGRIFLFYEVVLAYSILNQFYVPAEAATLPALVPKSHLPFANGLFFVTQQSAIIVGFSVAGLLAKLLGFSGAILLCAAFLFLAFISVSLLPKIHPISRSALKIEDAVVNFFKSIGEGYQFLKARREILYPFLLLLGFQVLLTVAVINVPKLATDIIKISTEAAGHLLVAPVGLGAVLGAVIIPKLLKKGWRKKKTIETFLLVISLMIFGVIFVVPILSGILRILISTILIFIVGIAFVGILIPAQTYLQEATPGGYRGRIFGNYWFILTILTIFPVVFSGAITDFFGVKFLFSLLLILIIATYIFSRKAGHILIQTNV